MHKNRLIELTSISSRSNRIGSKLTILPPTKIQQHEQLEKQIDKMIINNQLLSSLRNNYKKVANPTKEKQINKQVNKAVNQNRSLMKRIQSDVKKINEQLKKELSQGNRSNTIQVTRITQKASQALKDFKQGQQKFSDGVKDSIRRQATVIKGNQISEEEVESIMANPQKGQDMLKAKLLNSPSVELQNAVSDIMDKYNAIILLEKSMRECLELMQELSLLVQLAGQQLDSIEINIDQASDFTKKAQVKLEQAKGHHKSAKNKKCCIMILLLAAIAAVVIPVLITQL